MLPRGEYKKKIPLRKIDFFSSWITLILPPDSKKVWHLGVISLQPPYPETPLISLRGFSGIGGCRLVTPKCHTFLESGGKMELICEEKNKIFLNGKKFYFYIPLLEACTFRCRWQGLFWKIEYKLFRVFFSVWPPEHFLRCPNSNFSVDHSIVIPYPRGRQYIWAHPTYNYPQHQNPAGWVSSVSTPPRLSNTRTRLCWTHARPRFLWPHNSSCCR